MLTLVTIRRKKKEGGGGNPTQPKPNFFSGNNSLHSMGKKQNSFSSSLFCLDFILGAQQELKEP